MGAPESAPFFCGEEYRRPRHSMRKAKARAGTGSARAASRTKSGGRETPDLAEIRGHIADIVGSGAVGMVETTIEQVGKGHYLGMKYLFEMIGLYPATSTEDAAEDSLAAVLLRRLGIPEQPIPETGVTEDSRTDAGPAEDSLE